LIVTETEQIEAARWPWLLRAGTFTELVDRRARTTPDGLFLVDEHGTEVTFAGFADRVDRVAAALAAEGIGPGSRVAWQLPTRISTVLVMAALRRLGAMQAPIIPLYREREVRVALTTSGAEFFLVPGAWRGFDFEAMATGLAADGGPRPRVLVIGHEAPEAPVIDGVLPAAPSDPDEIAWIYFTSGSTGAPKGAQHTDATLLATGTGFAGHGRLGARGRELGRWVSRWRTSAASSTWWRHWPAATGCSCWRPSCPTRPWPCSGSTA
jgi:acyl-coenzyme A synthetase/AMP-(fatty) acid ligase